MADEFCLKMPDFHVTFRDLLHAVNLRHGTNGFTSLPKEGVLRIFSPWKIRRFRPGLNPRTWVPKASTLPLDHRSRYIGIGPQPILKLDDHPFSVVHKCYLMTCKSRYVLCLKIVHPVCNLRMCRAVVTGSFFTQENVRVCIDLYVWFIYLFLSVSKHSSSEVHNSHFLNILI